MRRGRGVLLVVLAVVVAALVSWFPGSPVRSDDALVGPPVPTAGRVGSLGSTWYCPGGWAGDAAAPRQRLVVTDPSGAGAPLRLSAHGPDGLLGEASLEVPPSGVLSVDVAEQFDVPVASLLVESSAPELVVEQRQFTESVSDQVPCATSTSPTWYFPAQTTLLGTNGQLVLFNPFPEDAGVDIDVAVEDGVRVPGPWQGLIVPAGSVRVLELGTEIQRRDQFALTVEARTGQVVAQSTQVLDTEDPPSQGLRLQVGVPRPSDDWVLATGVVGSGVAERLVVLNPGDEVAPVVVQVVPYGGAELAPEPFELEVPPGRYGVIDLSAESRVPADAFHAVRVESDPATPVVVGRVVDLSGPPATASTDASPGRPGVERGTTIGTGSPVAARMWVATGLLGGGEGEPMVFVHNPSSDPADVSASVLGGEADGAVVAEGVEVPAGDSVALPVSAEVGESPFTVLVEASAPVVVERTVTWRDVQDLSTGLAVAFPGPGAGPVALGG